MKGTLNQSTTISNGDQTQANAAIHQVQAVYSAAFWNITLQIQAAKISSQQYANSLNITLQIQAARNSTQQYANSLNITLQIQAAKISSQQYANSLNITLQIQAARNSTQQYANSLNVTSKQAQACLNQRAQNLTAVGNT